MELSAQVRRLLGGMTSRYDTVRAGIDVGFADAAASLAFREALGGVWMTVVADEFAQSAVVDALPQGTVHRLGVGSCLPFDDGQFEVAALNGDAISLQLVREIHRVLRPAGCLFFSVAQGKGDEEGFSGKSLYNIFLKNGFDVLSLDRPWWRFGRGGRVITVCARKKAWKERKGLDRGGSLPFQFGNTGR